ncbi:MAG: hypothetical protein NVSMB13_20630 [Mycobacteriales bacterium]
MAQWDRRSARALAKARDAAIRTQVRDAIAPFSPYWRERLAAPGRTAGAVSDLAALEELPAVGERDLCPGGDPADAAALVLQADEVGFALHAPGPRLRSAIGRRLVRPSSYRRLVEADTRPTSYLWAGLGFRFPLASTRSDLDLVARAGARLWRVLGLTGADVLVSAVPVEQSVEHQALSYAALAAGSPALFPGSVLAAVAALHLVPASVLAVPSAQAAELVEAIAGIGVDMSSLGTVLLVGAPAADERAAVTAALTAAGAERVVVLAVHAPSGARVLWAECRESVEAGRTAGYHSYPDLEVLQVVDPETGEPAPTATGPASRTAGGELVLTQLGLRGSALLRWRTGDLLRGPLSTEPCPGCGRRVTRVPDPVLRGALVARLDADTAAPALDLRAVSGALVGRGDVTDWRVEVVPGQLRAELAAVAGEEASAAAGASADLAAATGLSPDRITVRVSAGPLPQLADGLTARIAVRSAALTGEPAARTG